MRRSACRPQSAESGLSPTATGRPEPCHVYVVPEALPRLQARRLPCAYRVPCAVPCRAQFFFDEPTCEALLALMAR